MKNTTKTYIYDGDTFFYKDENGKKYRLNIHQDDSPESPREWDNLCTIACFHSRYNLGDKHDYDEPRDYIINILTEYVDKEKVIEYAKNPENSDVWFEDIVDEEGKTEHLINYINWNNQWDIFTTEYLYEDILKEISIDSCIELLSDQILILPLYLYDHSGITISLGDFGDKWDSGQVGWVLAFKDKIFEETLMPVLDENGEKIKIEYKHEGSPSTYGIKTVPITEDNWKIRAKQIAEGEVKIYDRYLTGDIYGYTLEEEQIKEFICPHCYEPYAEPITEWVEIDSCWGFYGDILEENGILENSGCSNYKLITE